MYPSQKNWSSYKFELPEIEKQLKTISSHVKRLKSSNINYGEQRACIYWINHSTRIIVHHMLKVYDDHYKTNKRVPY